MDDLLTGLSPPMLELVQPNQDGPNGRLPVERGLIALIGNSGSGKSTLFRLLEATVHAGGQSLLSPRRPVARWQVSSQLIQRRGQRVVVTPQENELIHPELTARGNIHHYLKALPWNRSVVPAVLQEYGAKSWLGAIHGRTIAALKAVGLEDKADRPADKLSGGEKRRLLLAMDVALGPKVLVTDEPLSQLDSSSADTIFRLLKKQSEEGPVLFTVHQPLDEWVEQCDQVWIVESGAKVVAALPGDLLVRAGQQMGGSEPIAYRILRGLKINAQETIDRLEAWAKYSKESSQPNKLSPNIDPPIISTPNFSQKNIAISELDIPLEHEDSDVEIPSNPSSPSTSSQKNYAREGSSSGRWIHSILHEIRTNFLSNIKSPFYWTMLLLFIGVTYLTNFFGSANQLPFSIPVATNALLISTLFVSTMSGVQVWTGRAGDRIRQKLLRRVGLSTILTSKAIPALFESILIAGLAWAGSFSLQLRETDTGWPDHFAYLPSLPQVPAVVVLMVFVGFVGWLQGVVISLIGTVVAQTSRIKHLRNPGRPRAFRWGGAAMDPVRRAYSIAVLLVVGQIGLGGAFGQITAGFKIEKKDFPTLGVDLLGSLSPLRWGYNAALVQEWRYTRCKIHDSFEHTCDSTFDLDLRQSTECAVDLDQNQSTVTPSQVTWASINSLECRSKDKNDSTPNSLKAKGETEAIAIFYQPSDPVEATRLDRLRKKRELLEERKSAFPRTAVSEAIAAENWARINNARTGKKKTKDYQCLVREANVRYEHQLLSQLVSLGMLRPQLVDVEWCWRNCPDVRPAVKADNTDTFMLEQCPLPGEGQGNEVMATFHRPIVQRSRELIALAENKQYTPYYPCRDWAHRLFSDPQGLKKKLDQYCAPGVPKLSQQEINILFCCFVTGFIWLIVVLRLALRWDHRIRLGG